MADDWKNILAGLRSDEPQSADSTDTEAHASRNDNDSRPDDAISDAKPTLTLFYEKKGRAGKPTTIITGFNPDSDAHISMADLLASTLKKKLGCGGSARGGEILLQGDRRESLRQLLPSLGYTKVKG